MSNIKRMAYGVARSGNSRNYDVRLVTFFLRSLMFHTSEVEFHTAHAERRDQRCLLVLELPCRSLLRCSTMRNLVCMSPTRPPQRPPPQRPRQPHPGITSLGHQLHPAFPIITRVVIRQMVVMAPAMVTPPKRPNIPIVIRKVTI